MYWPYKRVRRKKGGIIEKPVLVESGGWKMVLLNLSGWVVAIAALLTLHFTFGDKSGSLTLSQPFLVWNPDYVQFQGEWYPSNDGEMVCFAALINDGDYPEVFVGASLSLVIDEAGSGGILLGVPTDSTQGFQAVVVKPGEVVPVNLRYRLNLDERWEKYKSFPGGGVADSTDMIVALGIGGIRHDGKPFALGTVIGHLDPIHGFSQLRKKEERVPIRVLDKADFTHYADWSVRSYLMGVPPLTTR